MHVVRKTEAPTRDLPDERGTVRAIPLPNSRSEMDVHVIDLRSDGPDGAVHYHSSSENLYYVLEGQMRIRLGDGDVVLGPGDAAWIPPGLPHGVSVGGSEPVRLLEIYWPGPADFVRVQEESPPAD